MARYDESNDYPLEVLRKIRGVRDEQLELPINSRMSWENQQKNYLSHRTPENAGSGDSETCSEKISFIDDQRSEKIAFESAPPASNQAMTCFTPVHKMLKDDWIQSRVTLSNQSLGAAFIAAAVTAMCWVSANPLHAQERVRTAAGRLEIQSFKNPLRFFRIGPLQEELIGSVGVEYTDNSGLTNTNKISRLRVYQGLSLNTTLIFSHLNQLQFNFAGQLREDFYGNGRNVVSIGIAPDSLVQFQFAISDFQVRLYDRFSYIQDPTTNPTATNTANLNSLTNVIGAEVATDWNLAVLSLAGDYTYNNQSGSTTQGVTNPTTSGTRNSYRVTPSIGFHLSPLVLYGVNASLTRTEGSGGANTSGSSRVNSLNVGPFFRGKISRLTDIDLAAGASLFDSHPSIAPTYYVAGVIRHQFNRNLQVIFAASHDLVFTTGTDLTKETIFRLGTQVNLTRFITFTGTPFISFGNELSGPTQGNFKQYGVGVGLNWRPHRRWLTGISYDLIRRNGISAPDSYIQNTVAFEVSYRF
jgi:hypothetical protein